MYHNDPNQHGHDIPLSVTVPSSMIEQQQRGYPPQSSTAAHLLSPDPNRHWTSSSGLLSPSEQRTSSDSLSTSTGYKYGSRPPYQATTDIEEAEEAYLSPSGKVRHRVAGNGDNNNISRSISFKTSARAGRESPTLTESPTKQPPLVTTGASPLSHGLLFRRQSRHAFRKVARWWYSLHPFVVFGIVSFSLVVAAMTAYSTYNWAWGRLFGNISEFIPPNSSGVILLASITRIELEQLEASITWLPLGCGSEYTTIPISATIDTPNWYSHFPLKNAGSQCGRLNKPVEIVVNTGDPFRYDPEEDSYEFVEGSQHGAGAPNFAGSRTWIPSIVTFNTTEKLNPQFAVSRGWNAAAYYPWDAYKVLMRIWVSAPSPNSTEKGTAIPVVKVLSLDSPTGLPVESGSWEVVRKSNGVVIDVATEALFLIYRHAAVKGFAMVIFFVNWGLMLIMVWILVLAATDRSMKIPKEILLLPITAILTIPQLRATMPGVPNAFGILIDIPGYLFVMIVVVLCAIAIVLLMTHRRRSLGISLSRPFRSGIRSPLPGGRDKGAPMDHDDL
ncbi:hypothetical protein FRC03_008788 [Tulasnella sp. 419]|nr:hypothetical protein FRC03_008788 [Tulasnella sp. 419]